MFYSNLPCHWVYNLEFDVQSCSRPSLALTPLIFVIAFIIDWIWIITVLVSIHLHKSLQLEIPLAILFYSFLSSFINYFLRGYHKSHTALDTEMYKKAKISSTVHSSVARQKGTCKPINKYFHISAIKKIKHYKVIKRERWESELF